MNINFCGHLQTLFNRFGWHSAEIFPDSCSVWVHKWSQDRKWSPNWTTNDPGPQMIPDRKDGKDGVDRELAYVTTDVFIKAIL